MIAYYISISWCILIFLFPVCRLLAWSLVNIENGHLRVHISRLYALKINTRLFVIRINIDCHRWLVHTHQNAHLIGCMLSHYAIGDVIHKVYKSTPVLCNVTRLKRFVRGWHYFCGNEIIRIWWEQCTSRNIDPAYGFLMISLSSHTG